MILSLKCTSETDFHMLYCSVVGSDGNTVYDAYIEDGKLFYDNRWYLSCSLYTSSLSSYRFHKGQMIFIESKEHGQERLAHLASPDIA